VPQPAPPAWPQRAPAARGAWPLHDTHGSRAVEARAQSHLPPHTLMARAGWALARLALAVAPHARRIAVLAGPGNNGGDGLLAALHLHRLGLQVHVVHLADAGRLPPDAADALAQARSGGVRIGSTLDGLADADLVVDALLGLGLTRAPAGPIANAIDVINLGRCPVVAADLPSGLDADTGNPVGGPCVRADWTLSLLTLKPGLFTAHGRDLAGQVWFDPLGTDAIDIDPTAGCVAWIGATEQAPLPAIAPRLHAQHKGSFGDLTVVGGAPGMEGAAVLAATAALTAGAGRVYLASLAAESSDAAPPDLMRSPSTWLRDAAAQTDATVVCGCGGGRLVAASLPGLLAHAGRLILDADALNALAADLELQALLVARGANSRPTVLTPHPLEAARLLGSTAGQVQADRLSAAQQLAQRFHAVVVLKGSGSVVAAPEQCPWINGTGNAALAAPGSGDVLAGWLGGLWAQAPDSAMAGAVFAARTATWLHGRAADLLLDRCPGHAALPLRSARLADAMAEALAQAMGIAPR
jgi:ADP-dependent NAD(P)H-hydrate dehydratase / NAD(P)H-hydrate epimerase